MAHIDGDTSKFLIEDEIENVRYLLLDTPETVHPHRKEQPFGKRASEYVKNLLLTADKIEVEFDVKKRDKYQRMLAYVYVNGESVQKKVLERGLGRVGYVYESRRYLREFQAIEQEARKKELGVWKCSGYVTEKGYDVSKWCDEAENK